MMTYTATLCEDKKGCQIWTGEKNFMGTLTVIKDRKQPPEPRGQKEQCQRSHEMRRKGSGTGRRSQWGEIQVTSFTSFHATAEQETVKTNKAL